MTDPSDPLDDLLDLVLSHADEIAVLDAARAEAWASDVLALAAEWEVDERALVTALRDDASGAAVVALAALSALVDVGGLADPPEWASAVGSSRCVGAWLLRAGRDLTAAFLWADVHDERHVLAVDLVGTGPETVGDVVVGPGDLLGALDEEDARIEREEADAVGLAGRVVEALRHTTHPSPSTVANGRLLLRRLSALVPVDLDPPVAVEDEVPDPPHRDPVDDAYAREILERALGPSRGARTPSVEAVAELVAPSTMAPLTPAQRDAVFVLEWADWLGAVIGLVRAGEGASVDGASMVDHVNRCPEVTTTIPKADRPRIEWAFATLTAPWTDLGLVADGRLTPLGTDVLPAALHLAWSGDAQTS